MSVSEVKYIVGIHRYCYKAGEVAQILDTVFTNNRECYKVLYNDYSTDFIPIIDLSNYVILSQQDIDNNNIPKVTK